MSNTGSETDDLIGTTVGEHYRITAVLARGPNGVVYEATDDEVDEVCVVKVFDGARSADDEALVRMVRETRAVTTPPHANVATVYAAGALADGRPYVAMQRLLGPTFAELVARGQPVAPARVAELLSGVAKALDHAHRLGVTHGALHGRNVVLTISVESGEVAKVLDLGTLSLRAWPPADEEHVAPESKLNAPSPEMDVYALAVLACRLLTGESPAELRAAATARSGPSERERVVLGTELEDVLARALARDPKRRPWPATELVRELRAAAARIAAAPSSGPKAAPSGAPPRTLQGVGRDRGGHDTLMDRGGGRATSGSSDRLRAVAAPRLPPSSSPPRPSSSSLPPRPSVPSSIPRPSSSSLPPRPSSSPRPSPTSPRPRPGAPSGPSAPAPAAAAPEQRAPIEAPPAAPVASPDPAPPSAVIALPAPIVVVGSAEPDAPVVASPAAAAVAPPVPPAGPATALPASDAPAGPRDPRLPRTLELPIGSPPVAASEPQVAPVEAAPAVIESPRPPASASAGLDLADDDEEPRPRRSPVVPIAIVLTLLVGAAVAAYFVYRSRIATAPEGVATNASTGSGQPPSPVAAPQPPTGPVAPTQPGTTDREPPPPAPSAPSAPPPPAPSAPSAPPPPAPSAPPPPAPSAPSAPADPTPTAPTDPEPSLPTGSSVAERLAAAQAMMDSGRARRAEPLYRLVLRADPDNLDGWRGLGHASVRLRRGRQAIRAYEQYLRRAPGATDAAEIRERLRRLRESEARGGRAGGAEGAESGAAPE